MFLLLGMLLRLQAQCVEGDCKVLPHSGGDEAIEVVDNAVQDMHMELLQRDLKLSDGEKLRREAKETVTVKKWDCGKKPKAYQSTTANDNSWTKMQVLDLSTGEYETYFNVDLNAIAPDKIRSMNSCAINPKDGILYCSMQVYNKGSFLVRIDQNNTIGYVTKLLGWRYAATFDHEDNYYVSGQNQLTVLKDVSKMTALPSYNGLNNLGETPVTIEIDGSNMINYELGADFGISYAEWEGSGNHTYLVSVDDTQLLVVRVSPGPYKMWTLSTNLPPGAPGTPRVWGAAWKWGYNQSVYFAADDGLGLWELLADTVSLKDSKATFKNIAKANPTDWNDGFTCGDFFPPNIEPKRIPCKADLYQSTTEGKVSSTSSKTYLRYRINMDAAPTEVHYELNATGLLSINACATNPLDFKLYCNAQMANGQRIARIGENGTMGFIQQAPAGYAFAGAFDSKGNYWVYAQAGLFLVSGLKEKKSYDDYTLVAVASDEEWTPYYWAGTQQFKETNPGNTQGAIGADFVVVEEEGKSYLVSIVESAENSVSVVDITGAPDVVELVPGPDGATFWKSEGLPGPFPGNTTNTWGSAWQTDGTAENDKQNSLGEKIGRMLFSRDYGAELYEMDKFVVSDKTASFSLYSAAEDAAWHDGFVCYEEKKNVTEVP